MDRTFKEEIALKKSRIRTLEKDLNNRKEKLRETLGIVDYTHVICLNLTFLMACLHNIIIPKVLNFHVNNSYLMTSCACHACQIKLLKEEIALKKIKN